MHKAGWLLIITILCHATGCAQIKLPRLISNGMVLQHSQNLKIWGWAASGEKVNLVFDAKDYKTTANKEGEWMFNLPPQKAGGKWCCAY